MSEAVNSAGKMPAEMVQEWDHVWSNVVELQWLWNLHSDLWGNERHVALMQDILPGPLALIRRSLLFTLTVGIGRLLDPDESGKKTKPLVNLSLPRILSLAAHHHAEAVKSRLIPLLDAIRRLCEPIHTWRNKRVGHADREMILGLASEKLPDIDRTIFDQALAQIRDLLREVHTLFNSDEPMPFPDRTGDADELMGYIRDGYEARQAEIARSFL